MIASPVPFPDGCFELLPHHIWLWTDAVMGCHDHGVLPSVACLVAFNGAGVNIQGLMDHLGARPHEVLFGELVLDTDGSLLPNTTYRVTTRITDITRKQGRRIALFDSVTIIQQLIDEATERLAASIKQIWIVSRRE